MSKKEVFNIDKYLVLHCRGYYGEETLPILTGAIVAGPVQIQSGHMLSMGTPCITTNDIKTDHPVSEQDEAFEGGSANRILIINPFKHGVQPWTRLDISSRSLKPEYRISSPIEVLKVMENATLDVDKAARLRDYVNDIGCMSFVLSEKEKRAKQTIEFLKVFSRHFKHQFETWTHIPHPDIEVVSSLEKDEVLSIISFFNVKNVATILDTRKVDGILVVLESVLRSSLEKKKVLEPFDTICLLYTNYLENFVYLDGCHLNDYRSFDERTIEKLSKILRKKSMSKVVAQKKPKEEMSLKAPKKEDRVVMYDSGTISSDTTSTSGWGSSSTANFYYTNNR